MSQLERVACCRTRVVKKDRIKESKSKSKMSTEDVRSDADVPSEAHGELCAPIARLNYDTGH